VAGALAADDEGMSKAQRIAAVVVGVIAINLLVRFMPLPQVDVSSIPFPDLPDLPDWFGVVLKVKNLILIGIVVAVIVAAVVEDHRKKKAR
jgi:hypothetical protein